MDKIAVDSIVNHVDERKKNSAKNEHLSRAGGPKVFGNLPSVIKKEQALVKRD